MGVSLWFDGCLLYPGAPGKKLATFVCYCSNRICKQTKWFLVDIVGIWILSLSSSIDFNGEKETMLSPLMVHCICLLCLWFLFPCTSLCGPHNVRVCFSRGKAPLVPRASWKGGCFLWFLSVGSWVHRLLEKKDLGDHFKESLIYNWRGREVEWLSQKLSLARNKV